MNEKATLQKALFTIKKLKHLLSEHQGQSFEPIAITGLSCRFPQAVGKDAYWRMLKEGRNVISKIPERRWELLAGTDELDLRDPQHPYWGGFLSEIDMFDAYFFGISPREAQRIDPQHRLILEVAHEAIEDAGIPIEALAGSNTGVFASLYVSQLAHLQKMDAEMDALYLPTGNAISISANRLSYLFDLRGPSVIIDSACSSSMTALYLACLNLQNKVCDMALVCGAKLNLLPYVNYVLTKAKMLSPDGQCKTFDASANGYVQGEGVGVIVLKPLAKALQDKDRIYAAITGCAVNQDGRTNGLTAPNGLQQEALLRAAYQTAKINPQELSYIECHGTGTFLGDPIEIQALGEVVGKSRQKEHPCYIGSVKTNIGHLEPAAGIASLIKVALALKNKQIPPHLNFAEPNPHIAFDKYQFRVPTSLQDWPAYGGIRTAGLSGFGFGGTNAHVVMQEVNVATVTEISPSPGLEIFTLSAKNITALEELVSYWCNHLEQYPDLNLADICYSLHLRRSHYSHRLAIVARNTRELHDYLMMVRDNHITVYDNIFIGHEHKNSRKSPLLEDPTTLDLQVLAKHYIQNTTINWKKFEEGRVRPHCEMPLYPWQHKSYWPPLGHKVSHQTPRLSDHPLQGRRMSSPLATIQFEFFVSSQRLPDLKDTYNIVHAGYYLEIIAFAVDNLFPNQNFIVADHQFLLPIMAPQGQEVVIHFTLVAIAEKEFDFHFYSKIQDQTDWHENARGRLEVGNNQEYEMVSIEAIQARCHLQESSEKLYERILAMGMPAGDSIRWTQSYWLGQQEILCAFQQPACTGNNESYKLAIHPGVFDACIQPLFKLLPEDFMQPYIASGARRLHYIKMQQGPYYLWGILHAIPNSPEKIVGDCCLLNYEGKVIAYLEEMTLTQLDNKIQMADLMNAKSSFSRSDLAALNQSERLAAILNLLIEQVAIIFATPREDISADSSLKELGIDSLMAIVLMRAIEVGFEVHYSMQLLLEGPTLAEIAQVIATNIQPDPKQNEPISIEKPINSWVVFKPNKTQAQLRLFCLPYGGGGASIYRQWHESLPDSIEVCPIQLPGREERMAEQPINNLAILLEELIENMMAYLDKPFALFGYSFGSLIAFELARHLRKYHLPMPEHLFVAAFPDPRVPSKSLNRLLTQLETINIGLDDIKQAQGINRLSSQQLQQLSAIFNENGIMGYDDVLMGKEIIQVLLPIFVGDMSIVKSYNFYTAPPLDLPLTIFAGKQDAWVAYSDHLDWHEHTSKQCRIHTFDSGHLFIKDARYRQEMFDIIVNELLVGAEIN